jgi:hypothetical protein
MRMRKIPQFNLTAFLSTIGDLFHVSTLDKALNHVISNKNGSYEFEILH